MGSETVDGVTFGEPLGRPHVDDGLPLRRARSFRRPPTRAEPEEMTTTEVDR